MNWLLSCMALPGLVATADCKSLSANSHQNLGLLSFAPSNPAQIQILHEESTRPHLELGEIQAQPSNGSVSHLLIEQALQGAAAKLGANTAVIVTDHNQVTDASVTGPLWAHSGYTVSGQVIFGMATRSARPQEIAISNRL